jgi:hypothetical protein
MIYYYRYLTDLCVPWLEESSPLFERSTSGFCPLINEWNKKSGTFIERQCFCVLSNSMTKGYQSSHNETAAFAWRQQNADWWSEMKKTNQDTHHPENLPTNRRGTMDTDDEAAGGLRSTDQHCIIVAALEGHKKQPIHYHALRNYYTSLMCASYMANHPYENVARSPILKQQNLQTKNNLDDNSF